MNDTRISQFSGVLPFNPKPSTMMHVDLNSCFATVEQQANPLLRGKPIAVAAYKSDGGCILAPSVEAKRLGIKTGMRVKDGKMLYPDLIVLEPDPWKYRNVHMQLRKLLTRYTSDVVPKSIDEFILNLEGFPAMRKGIEEAGREIKQKIKTDIGEWLTVSIGIAPNRFLAKLAAGLKKPDGLETIDAQNFGSIYCQLQLTDLHGIKNNNAVRLNRQNIFTLLDFYSASPKALQMAFHSVTGYYWYLRLHGWEIDDVEFGRHSYGNSVALGVNLTTPEQLSPVLMKLVEKMSARVRRAGYTATGVHLSILYKTGAFWRRGVTVGEDLFAASDIYKIAYKLLTHSPYKLNVHTIAVSCFGLTRQKYSQPSLLEERAKKEHLVYALDQINEKWGNFTITPARMLGTSDLVKDRVAFGGIKELEEFVLR
jgi:DNA polymerase IV